MRRALLYCAAIAFAIACGDSITEPIPDRTPATTATKVVSVATPVAFATTTTEDGLSISTDKDDYQPGDTVHFTGSGWQPGDVLDIVLTDDPLTHEPHTWSVNVGEDGMFHDSTYVVDTGDLGVTFTLVATSRGTGRSLTVVFTDGNLNDVSLAPSTVTVTQGNSAVYTASVRIVGNATQCTITLSILNVATVIPAGATASFNNNPFESGNATVTRTLTITTTSATPAGTYPFTVQAAEAAAGQGISTDCQSPGGIAAIAGTLIVQAAPPTKLAFTTPARTAAVGQCTAVLTVQSQLADGTPANVTSNTTLTLTSSSPGGTFHTNAACTTSGAVSIASGTNSASFFYKDANDGSPLITVAGGVLTSATQTQTITAGNALVTVTATPTSPTVFGQSVSFTAVVSAVAPAVGTPTGSVTFRDGAACSDPQIGGSKTLAGGSATSDATTTLSVANHTITACYGGGGGFNAQMGQIAHTVNKALTSLVLTKTPSGHTVFSQAVVFTAHVNVTAPGAGTPDGDVKFYEFAAGGTCASPNGTLLGTETLASAEAQLSVSDLAASTTPHTISACYQGSTNFETSGNSIAHTVDKAPTTTDISSNANPSVFSQPVTFTATVTADAPATATPEGSVNFEKGGTACGTGTTVLASGVALVSGVATFSSSTLPVGSYTIRACYSGNSNFVESDDDLTQTVNRAPTTTTLTSDANPSVFSELVTFSATVVADPPATATPTGSVTFEEGGTACGVGTTILSTEPLVSGAASFSSSGLAVGSHAILACYAETANFEDSFDDLEQVVDKAPTTTVVASSVNPSVFSQPVTFNVTVDAPSPATATPVGSVTLKDGNCSVVSSLGGPTALDVDGKASFIVSSLGAGLHTVTACYTETADFEGSDGNVPQTVDQALTTTAVLSSVNPSLLNQPVTFTATVSPVAPALATPDGNVSFREGTCSGTLLSGPSLLNGSGEASFSISSLAIGSHTITACYAGTTNFVASNGFVSQQVRYNFSGFFAPVDRPNMMNVSKAGQAIPLKWRLTDFHGAPITNLTGVTVQAVTFPCASGATVDQIEEYAAGSSGLHNLGDGNYQFNWKTPPDYLNSCKKIALAFGTGGIGYTENPSAFFTFKK